jgi:antitoxin (DNA-binding transcriptional repressor) of toxin-antitoxin stability system
MLVVSSSEFRANQGKYLGLVAEGKDVLLRSREKGSFKIIPVKDDDTRMSKEEYFAMLDRGLQNFREGKGRAYTLEELRIKMGL